MWSQDEDDAGGFVQSDVGNASTKISGERKARNMVSVSVEQALKLTKPDVGLVIHRQKVAMVEMVGKVISVIEQTTNITFQLQDETGPTVEIQLWTVDEVKSNNPVVVEGTYVQVHGQARTKDDRVFVAAFKVTPITDMNEITLHNLQVMFDCLSLKKLKENYLTAKESGTFMMMDTSGPPPSRSIAAPDEGFNIGLGAGLTKIQTLILKTVSGTHAPEGVSFDTICSGLKSVDKKVIKEALDFLANEGHVYSTIDDYHFKSTDVFE